MKRLPSLLVALIALSTALVSAHLKVDRTLPATGATLASAPRQIQVWFTEMPTLAVSAVTLEGPSGKVELGKLALGKLHNDPDKSIVADVVSTLAAGKYKASWRTSGADGHVLSGTFEFTVKTP